MSHDRAIKNTFLPKIKQNQPKEDSIRTSAENDINRVGVQEGTKTVIIKEKKMIIRRKVWIYIRKYLEKVYLGHIFIAQKYKM